MMIQGAGDAVSNNQLSRNPQFPRIQTTLHLNEKHKTRTMSASSSSSSSTYAVKNLELNGSTPDAVQTVNNDDDFRSITTPSYTIDDVAKELRPWLRWDGSRNAKNKVLVALVYMLGPGLWYGLFLGGIYNSVPLEITFAALMATWAVSAMVANNVSPEALQFYVEHPDVAKKMGTETRGFALSITVFQTVMTVLAWVFVVKPFTHSQAVIDTFGKQAPTILMVVYIVGLPLGIIAGSHVLHIRRPPTAAE